MVTSEDGVFNFRIAGGSDVGEFPVITDVLPPDTRGVEYRSDVELVTQVLSFPKFTANLYYICLSIPQIETSASAVQIAVNFGTQVHRRL